MPAPRPSRRRRAAPTPALAPPPPEPTWAAPAGWALVGLVGIALVIVAFAFHPIGDDYAESDFYGGYAQGARLLQLGHLDAARYGVVGPVYEAALALLGFATR